MLDARERHHPTDGDALVRATGNRARVLDAVEPHENFRRELTPLHVGIEVGPTGDGHRLVRRVIGEHLRRLLRRFRREVAKRGQPHHEDDSSRMGGTSAGGGQSYSGTVTAASRPSRA